jgi:hypothetical protein
MITYNLCRINMFPHDINYEKLNIAHGGITPYYMKGVTVCCFCCTFVAEKNINNQLSFDLFCLSLHPQFLKFKEK